jgi:hypothetical protein
LLVGNQLICLLICMLNLLFPCWNWLIIFEPFTYVEWDLHKDNRLKRMIIDSPINDEV